MSSQDRERHRRSSISEQGSEEREAQVSHRAQKPPGQQQHTFKQRDTLYDKQSRGEEPIEYVPSSGYYFLHDDRGRPLPKELALKPHPERPEPKGRWTHDLFNPNAKATRRGRGHKGGSSSSRPQEEPSEREGEPSTGVSSAWTSEERSGWGCSRG
eukprot:RCo055328